MRFNQDSFNRFFSSTAIAYNFSANINIEDNRLAILAVLGALCIPHPTDRDNQDMFGAGVDDFDFDENED